MRLQSLAMPAALVLAFAVGVSPTFADQGNRGERGRGQQQARSRDDGRADRGARSNGGQARGGSAARAVPRAVPRDQGTRGYVAPRVETRRPEVNRGYDGRAYENRRYDGGARFDNRRDDSRRYGYDRRYDNRAYTAPRYTFVPRVARPGFGVSIFAGRPFGFSFGFGWRPSWAYRFTIRPGITYGGVSFLVSPPETAIYVDGGFVGYAQDFGGQPLPVVPGWHRVELQAPGYEPVLFDVNVLPGQVIPYQGSLVPAYGY